MCVCVCVIVGMVGNRIRKSEKGGGSEEVRRKLVKGSRYGERESISSLDSISKNR